MPKHKACQCIAGRVRRKGKGPVLEIGIADIRLIPFVIHAEAEAVTPTNPGEVVANIAGVANEGTIGERRDVEEAGHIKPAYTALRLRQLPHIGPKIT